MLHAVCRPREKPLRDGGKTGGVREKLEQARETVRERRVNVDKPDGQIDGLERGDGESEEAFLDLAAGKSEVRRTQGAEQSLRAYGKRRTGLRRGYGDREQRV